MQGDGNFAYTFIYSSIKRAIFDSRSIFCQFLLSKTKRYRLVHVFFSVAFTAKMPSCNPVYVFLDLSRFVH